MAVFVFDIETIPDVELGRRIYDLGDLSDKQVGYVMQAKRREEAGTEFLSYEQHRVVAISVALRSRDTFKVWSLGVPDARVLGDVLVVAIDLVLRVARGKARGEALEASRRRR